MAEQDNTDRLAKGLLDSLKDILNKPVPGTAPTQPKPQVDDDTLLEKIKDFLNQSLPGTAPTAEQSKPAASGSASSRPRPAGSGSSSANPSPAAQALPRPSPFAAPAARETKEAMLKRQAQELEALKKRHEQEKAAMGFQESVPMVAPKTAPKAASKDKSDREPRARKMGDGGGPKERRGRGKGREKG